MSVKIQNLTRRPVWLRLNSGRELRLSPRSTSSEIDDVQLAKNSRIEKLRTRSIIAVHKVKEKKMPTARSETEEKPEVIQESPRDPAAGKKRGAARSKTAAKEGKNG